MANNNKQKYAISVSGIGSKDEILEALQVLINSITNSSKADDSISGTYEDETLCTKISENP